MLRQTSHSRRMRRSLAVLAATIGLVVGCRAGKAHDSAVTVCQTRHDYAIASPGDGAVSVRGYASSDCVVTVSGPAGRWPHAQYLFPAVRAPSVDAGASDADASFVPYPEDGGLCASSCKDCGSSCTTLQGPSPSYCSRSDTCIVMGFEDLARPGDPGAEMFSYLGTTTYAFEVRCGDSLVFASDGLQADQQDCEG